MMLFRLVVAGLLLLAGAPAGAQAPRAPADETFTVTDITVDVTDASALQAREKAMLDGQRQAFLQLVQRLSSDPNPRIPRLDEALLNKLVRSIDVAGERTSAVRYLASLTVRFNPVVVRDVLSASGVSFTEVRARPVLILPVYMVSGRPQLFDDPNPWRDAWAGRSARTSLVPTALPLGDLEDLSEITAAQAVAGDRARLETIGRRYGAADTAVAVATMRLDPQTSKPTLALSVTRFSPSGDSTLVESFSGEAGQAEALLARAVDWVERELERLWKEENAVGAGQEERRLVFVVPIQGLDEWTEIRRRLSGIGLVKKTEVAGLNRREGRIAVSFLGEIGQLKSALAQREIELVEGDEPMLRLAGPVRR